MFVVLLTLDCSIEIVTIVRRQLRLRLPLLSVIAGSLSPSLTRSLKSQHFPSTRGIVLNHSLHYTV